MKVILLQDVAKVGRKHEIVNVSDGFAANMLFPRRLAELASQEKIAALEKRKAAAKGQAELHAAQLVGVIKTLDGARVEITTRANEKGHLYKSIVLADVLKAIQASHNVLLPKEIIDYDKPIKTTGEHPLSLSSGPVKGTLTVHIVGV